jgi:guanylate kinase
MTTRPPRNNEVNGRDYIFVSKEEFLKRRKRGELLEWATNFGTLYGTPKACVEKELRNGADVLLTIDVKGARQIKRKNPASIHIFLMPPSLAELERRLRNRATDKQKDITKRLTIAQREMTQSKQYDYIVVNDSIGDAVARLVSIVKGESKKRSIKRRSK